MTAVAQKTVLTGCLAPIDKGGLEQLIANGKANPKVIKTLKCKTVAEGKFRHANYIRNLAPYIVDEPPGLLGRRHRAQSVGSVAGRARLVPCGGPARQRRSPRLDRQQARTRTRGRPQHHGGVGHRRRQREAGRLHRRAHQGRHGMRGHSEERDRRAGDPRQEMVAGRQHVHPARSISKSASRRNAARATGVRETIMGSLALSRVEADDRPSPSIADEVAGIARKELAPLALAIDAGTVYPDALLRGLGEVGAWGSHVPQEGLPICAAPSSRSPRSARSAAPPPSWRGARTRWSGTPRIRPI